MKSLDVVVLCKLFILQTRKKSNWTYAELADEVCLSVGETHASVRRLTKSRVFDAVTKSVIPSSMKEFLISGVKYAFPALIGTRERGILTAHSAPVFQNELTYSESDTFVWPFAKGTDRGLSVTPLGANVPLAVLKDRNLYDFCALIDGIRVGKTREAAIAVTMLESMIRDMNGNHRL